MIYPKLVALALCALSALAAPSPHSLISERRGVIYGQYIITLKEGQNNVSLEAFSSILSPESSITRWWEYLGGFAGEFLDVDLDTLRADPRVDAIESDTTMTMLVSVSQCASFPQHHSASHIIR
jgi:hypothetical protein